MYKHFKKEKNIKSIYDHLNKAFTFQDSTHRLAHGWADAEGLCWPDVPERLFAHGYDLAGMLDMSHDPMP